MSDHFTPTAPAESPQPEAVIVPPLAAPPDRPPTEPPTPVVMADDDPDEIWGLDQAPPQATASPEVTEQPPLSRLADPTRTYKPRVKPPESPRGAHTFQQKLLILDSWRRSGLPAGDFAPLVGVSRFSLYDWRKRFDEGGPAALQERPRGATKGSRVPEPIKRAILMMRQDNPEWGCQRISDMLARGDGLGVSAGAIARVLRDANLLSSDEDRSQTQPERHRDHIRFFERAKPNQLWQTDIFTFMLKRQNRRVHLVAFLDDHSRFIVGYGLHATASTALVIEVFRAAIASYQAPEELLSDQGPQYFTWRGTSAFRHECDARGVKHIVARAHHPQTLGKTERFWGTIWRECLARAVFLDLEDARRRIGHFIDYYNFQRTHSGVGGLTPADRFFGAAPQVLTALKARVAANAKSLASNGIPREPLFISGKIGDQAFSLHSEGERVILTKSGEDRKEIDLAPPAAPEVPTPVTPHAAPAGEDGNEQPPEPGVSAIDEVIS